jgi:hypothetical protein
MEVKTWDVRPRLKRLEDSVGEGASGAPSESKALSASSAILGCTAIEWRRCPSRRR